MSFQRIEALQNRLVPESNENSVDAQDVDELVVKLQRVKIISLLIGTETDCVVPCWSCRRQVELDESTGRHVEIDEELVADDDQRGGVFVAWT